MNTQPIPHRTVLACSLMAGVMMKSPEDTWPRYLESALGIADYCIKQEVARQTGTKNIFEQEAFLLNQIHALKDQNEALKAEKAELVETLKDLVTAVMFADPPKEFNGVLCHQARVPIEFIQQAKAALAKAKGGRE